MIKMIKNPGFYSKPATIYNMHKYHKIGPAQDLISMGKMKAVSWCLTVAKTDKVRAENDSKVTKVSTLFTKSESSFGKGKTIRHYDSDGKIRKNPRKSNNSEQAQNQMKSREKQTNETNKKISFKTRAC